MYTLYLYIFSKKISYITNDFKMFLCLFVNFHDGLITWSIAFWKWSFLEFMRSYLYNENDIVDLNAFVYSIITSKGNFPTMLSVGCTCLLSTMTSNMRMILWKLNSYYAIQRLSYTYFIYFSFALKKLNQSYIKPSRSPNSQLTGTADSFSN